MHTLLGSDANLNTEKNGATEQTELNKPPWPSAVSDAPCESKLKTLNTEKNGATEQTELYNTP